MNDSNKPTRAAQAAALAALALIAGCGGGGSESVSREPTAGGTPLPRGTLISAVQTGVVPRAESDRYLTAHPEEQPLVGGAPSCDVQVYELIYATVGPNGEYVEDSSGLQVPTGCAGPYPMLLVNHGTTIMHDSTETTPAAVRPTVPYFAGDGYIVVNPDYSGYYKSTLGYHPYQVVEDNARVTIDAVRAARQWLSAAGVVQSGKFFIFGTSQGGGVTMATQMVMERDHPGEFAITATVPSSGSYDLETTMINNMLEPNDANAPAVTKSVLLITGYENVYGDIYGSPSEVFQSPWSENVTGLLPGDMTPTELVAAGILPARLRGPGGLFTDTWANDFLVNAGNPMRVRLRENGLVDWTPVAPMALCGSSLDPAVDFQNTLTAQANFASRGVAVPVEDVENDPEYSSFIAVRTNGIAPEDAEAYHGDVVHTACESYAKLHVFDPLR